MPSRRWDMGPSPQDPLRNFERDADGSGPNISEEFLSDPTQIPVVTISPCGSCWDPMEPEPPQTNSICIFARLPPLPQLPYLTEPHLPTP